jgi:hypothetical protein
MPGFDSQDAEEELMNYREALEELTSALEDAYNRASAGDGLAIRSNMLHATWVQAKELLSVEHCFVTGNPCGTDTWGENGCQCVNCIAWREKGGLRPQNDEMDSSGRVTWEAKGQAGADASPVR